MINTGFKLTAKDLKKLSEFKHSAAYSTYLKCIKSSPVYVSIMKEHSDKVNIEDDVNRLKSDGLLPDNISADTLSSLFRLSISRMAINLIADAVILKELEDKSVDDVIHDIREDANILYLTGMAEDKYYKEAEKRLEEGQLKRDDVAYRGLMAWMKLREKSEDVSIPAIEAAVPTPPPPPVPAKPKKSEKLNLDSLDIDLGE